MAEPFDVEFSHSRDQFVEQAVTEIHCALVLMAEALLQATFADRPNPVWLDDEFAARCQN